MSSGLEHFHCHTHTKSHNFAINPYWYIRLSATIDLLYGSILLPFLDNSCKWNHVICSLRDSDSSSPGRLEHSAQNST